MAIPGVQRVQADLPGTGHGGDQGGICWGRCPSRQARLFAALRAALQPGISSTRWFLPLLHVKSVCIPPCIPLCIPPCIPRAERRAGAGTAACCTVAPSMAHPAVRSHTHACAHACAHTGLCLCMQPPLIPSPGPRWHFLMGKESSCPAPICTGPSCPLRSTGRMGLPCMAPLSPLPCSAWQEPWLGDTRPGCPPQTGPSGSQSRD